MCIHYIHVHVHVHVVHIGTYMCSVIVSVVTYAIHTISSDNLPRGGGGGGGGGGGLNITHVYIVT